MLVCAFEVWYWQHINLDREKPYKILRRDSSLRNILKTVIFVCYFGEQGFLQKQASSPAETGGGQLWGFFSHLE